MLTITAVSVTKNTLCIFSTHPQVCERNWRFVKAERSDKLLVLHLIADRTGGNPFNPRADRDSIWSCNKKSIISKLPKFNIQAPTNADVGPDFKNLIIKLDTEKFHYVPRVLSAKTPPPATVKHRLSLADAIREVNSYKAEIGVALVLELTEANTLRGYMELS